MLWACLLAFYGLVNSGLDVTEGMESYLVAQQFISHGSIAFPFKPEGNFVGGIDGRFYNAHELGNAIPLLPTVFIGNMITQRVNQRFRQYLDESDRITKFLVSFHPCVYIAVTILFLFLLLHKGLGIALDKSILTSLAYGFGSMLVPYSRMLWEGVLATTCLTASYCGAFIFRRTGSLLWLSISGFTIGFGIITRITLVLFLPFLAYYIAAICATERRSYRPVLQWMSIVAPFILWQLFYNYIRTGKPWLPAVALPQYAENNALDGSLLIGLVGMFLSPGKSVFLFSPITLFCLLGIKSFKREHPLEFLISWIPLCIYVLVHAKLRNWSGDWGWGPRYLLIILPITALALPYAFCVRSNHWWKALVGIIIATSVFIQVVSVLINWHYRYSFLLPSGRVRHNAVIWTMKNSQFVDAMSAAYKNLRRIFGVKEPLDVVPEADPVNVLASNTANFWWLTLMHMGFPRLPLLGCVTFLSLSVLMGLIYLMGVCKHAETE